MHKLKRSTATIVIALLLLIFSIVNQTLYAQELSNNDSVSQLIKDHNSKYLTINSGQVRGYNKSTKTDDYVDITHYLNRAKKEMVFPLQKKNYIVTSDFGVRRHPFLGTNGAKEIYSLPFHSGLDIAYANIKGDDVYSVLNGRIDEISPNLNSYGNLVVVDHGGMKTYYAHLDTIDESISVGDSIKAGQRIGTVGSTGRSTGAHLHIEFNIGNVAINPRIFLEGQFELLNKPTQQPSNKPNSKNVEKDTSKDMEVKDFKLEVLELDNTTNLDEALDQIDVNSILDTENSFIEIKLDQKSDNLDDIKFDIIPLAKNDSDVKLVEQINDKNQLDNTQMNSSNKISWSLIGHNDFEVLRLDRNK
ncbi:MAG TPA: M23 family metallopeptidase [Tissierellaceae bacterium]